jgi:hypothetical protein
MQKFIIYLAPLILLVTSCKKWLDVKPVTQVAAEQLYSTSEGFEEALDGVYTRCSKRDLYGTELTMGLPDVLALDWLINPNGDYLNYLQSSLYNYKDANFISKKDSIWGGLYNAIANDNLLLQHVDSGKVLSAMEHSLIKGEALALRAYLHFDILRLFAPSYFTGSGSAGVPYVTAFSNKVTPTSSVADVMKLILKDLNDAKSLLREADPILSADYVVGYPGDIAASEISSPTLFLQNRRHRLNYYAVCGELARAYLYMNDKTNALSNALEVINSKKFPWTKQADFINPDPKLKDRILYNELLFAWPIPTYTDTLTRYFGAGGNSLYITPDMASTIYETGGLGASDLRYKQWFNPGSYISLVKYSRDPDTNRHPLVAPAIRLSEMYYIAAESSYASDPGTALSYVDSVRSARGVDILQVTSPDDFMTQLVKEARKEFYGEGQLFFMYKRLNRGIVGPTGIINAPLDKTFVLPLPLNEIEFGGR